MADLCTNWLCYFACNSVLVGNMVMPIPGAVDGIGVIYPGTELFNGGRGVEPAGYPQPHGNHRARCRQVTEPAGGVHKCRLRTPPLHYVYGRGYVRRAGRIYSATNAAATENLSHMLDILRSASISSAKPMVSARGSAPAPGIFTCPFCGIFQSTLCARLPTTNAETRTRSFSFRHVVTGSPEQRLPDRRCHVRCVEPGNWGMLTARRARRASYSC